MKRNSILAVVAGAAALGLGSLGSAMADDIPIGVIANLTGQDVNTSVQMVRGVQIAADEINKAGGVNGKTIKLIVEDSEYKTQEALTAAITAARRPTARSASGSRRRSGSRSRSSRPA